MPRFVGDVRCATSPFGSSWKLSGGKECSSALTKISKKRHVRRAILRNVLRSAAVKGVARESGRGALTALTIAGENAQSRRKGAANGHAAGFATVTTTAAITATS